MLPLLGNLYTLHISRTRINIIFDMKYECSVRKKGTIIAMYQFIAFVLKQLTGNGFIEQVGRPF
jgi:hypothetical protein